jgi:C-terminal processing protease CtpA/Prc
MLHRTIAIVLVLYVPMPLALRARDTHDRRVATSAVTQKPQPWFGFGFRWTKDGNGDRILHVAHVAAGGPAERCGLRPGDLIRKIAGQRVGFGDDLEFLLFLSSLPAGRAVPLFLVREGKSLTLTIEPVSMPEERQAAWRQAIEAARQKRVNTTGARAQP